MKIKTLDQAILLVDRGKGVSSPMWYEAPVTKEEADATNFTVTSAIESLRDIPAEKVMSTVSALLSKNPVEAKEGIPWTIRRAMISTLYANTYGRGEKTSDGSPKPEKQEVVAQMQSIGYAFQHAPKMGFVTLDAEEMQLVRRKMYELPLPGLVAAEINHYFDQLEDKTKTEVIFGIDNEDIDPSSISSGE